MHYIRKGGSYRLMYDDGEGPRVIYDACNEGDAIREKRRCIQQEEIYPVIFRSHGPQKTADSPAQKT